MRTSILLLAYSSLLALVKSNRGAIFTQGIHIAQQTQSKAKNQSLTKYTHHTDNLCFYWTLSLPQTSTYQ